MEEIWKDVKDYEGLYQVSNLGRVKNKKGKILKTHIVVQYEYIILSKKSIQKNHRVHRLVAKAFLNNPKKYREINHKDCNKLNNKVENLEWCSRSQNLLHCYKNGLRESPNKNKFYDKNCHSKSVIQFDKNRKFIKKWSCIKLASDKLKINKGDIVSCCKHIPHHITAGGYIWEYAKEK